jgi:hypothetical protein
MRKAREGSLLTQPSEAKPDPSALSPGQLPLSGQEGEYSNEFLGVAHHANPFKSPSKGFVAGSNGHRVSRSKTEPRQEGGE